MYSFLQLEHLTNVLVGTQLWEAEMGLKSILLGLVCNYDINFASPKHLFLGGAWGPTQGSTHMRQNPTAWSTSLHPKI